MPRKPLESLTREEVSGILSSAIEDDHDYMFLRLMVKTGRRFGEVRAITPKDVDFKNGCLWTSIEKKRKAERRQIFLDETSLILLRKLVSAENIGRDERIFKRSDRTLKRLPERYARKAGLAKHVTCHSFRHYVITSLISEGWPYDQIQKITGHKSITTLAIYDHAGVRVVEDKFREVLARL
jgi:integrase